MAAIQRVLGRVADLAIAAHGGFPQAERRRVFFSRALEEDYGGAGDGGAGEGDAAVPEELVGHFQARCSGSGREMARERCHAHTMRCRHPYIRIRRRATAQCNLLLICMYVCVSV